MSKAAAEGTRGIGSVSWKSKISLILIFTMVFSTFMYQGWYQPKPAAAAVGALNAWTNVYAATASTISVNVTSSAFTVSAGTDRILLVAVQSEIGTANTTISSMTVTYGGVALTPIATTGATSNRSHAWMGYLLNSQIPAGSNTINVQATAAANTFTGVQIAYGAYTGVNQTTPINDNSQSAVGSTTINFVNQVDFLLDGLTVYCANNGGTAPTMTPPAGFTTQAGASSTTGGFGGFVAATAVHAAAGNYPGTTGFTFGGTTSTRSALVVASLRPTTVTAAPAEVGGTLAVTPQSGTFVDSPMTITENFTSTVAPTSCRYTLNNWSSSAAGTVSGTGPYTCTATGVTSTNGTALTIAMDMTNASGTSTHTATLARTVDTIGPADGSAIQATVASSTQINLNWGAGVDAGAGLAATNTYKLVRATGATPPADCTGTAVYQGTAQTFNDTGRTPNTQYAYRVCAFDNFAHASTGTTVTATTSSTCTANTPTLTIAPATGIVAKGGSTTYTVSVTNNDSGAGCSAVSFTINVGDSNLTAFSASTLAPPSPLSIAPGATGTSTLTATSLATAAFGAQNVTTIGVTAAGHTPPANVTATTKVGNTMLHNSSNTNSTKWAPGGWGIAGGQYGEFVCSTCHTSVDTNNIKRIRETISIPPLADRPVNFQSLTTPNGFGDDTGGHATSQKICEVCHTQTTVHKYNTAGQTDFSHQNATDCILCHKHNQAFAPTDCGSCHGNPPGNLASQPYATGSQTAGKHTMHATTLGYGCTTCHNNYSMPSTVSTYTIDINFSFDGSTTGTYDGQTGVRYSAPNTATGTQTCSTVYCHGSTLPDGTDKTPQWTTTATAACGTCHLASNATPPSLGSHAQHAGTAPGQMSLACSSCHGPAAGGQGHVTGTVSWSLDLTDTQFGASAKYNNAASGTTAGLAPSAAYQSCSTVYCHSNVQGASGAGAGAPSSYASPQWGGTALCGSCHSVQTDGTATGSHPEHAITYGIACANCHSGGGSGTVNHANYNINTNFTGEATGTVYSQSPNTPGNGYGTCSTSYCHSNVQGTNGTGAPSSFATPTWGAAGSVTCGSCHADMSGATPSGSHLKHANSTSGYNLACAACHTGYTASTVTIATHVNQTIEVALSIGGGSYSGGTVNGDSSAGGGYGTCSTNYCHSTGQAVPVFAATPTWGNAASGACGTCHGADATTPPASAAHNTHVGGTNVYKFSCNKCHNVTVTGTADSTTMPGIASKAIHVNTTREVDLNTADPLVGTGATDNGAGSCSNVYCHSTGKAGIVPTAQLDPAYGGSHFSTVNWGDSLDCAGCHGKTQAGYPDYTMADRNLDQGTARANSHQSGTHRLTPCNICHVNTTADGATIASNTHVNAAINVNIDPAAGAGAAYNPDRSCSNVSCHGTTSPVWGAAGDCTTCHEAGAVNISGFHSRHWEVAAGNAIERVTGNASTPTYYQFQCNTCHNGGTHPTGASGTNFADLGFNITWAPAAYQTNGVYTANTPNANDTVDTRGQKISTDGSCSSVYCHSSGIAPGAAGPTYANIAWNAPSTNGCGVCHEATPTTNRHAVHAATYSYGCTECHQATVSNNTTISDKTKHVNAINDVAWKTGGVNAGSDNYETAATDTCSNLYCHSKGTSNVAPYGAPNTTAVWTAATTTECIGCHNGDAASTGGGMNTNQHAAHVSNVTANGVNYSCDICHSTTASGNRTISTPANHVNKLVNVAFTALNNGSTYTGTNQPGDAVGSCNNLYCHSIGNTAVPVGQLPATANTIYTNPSWSLPGTIGCNGCHGRTTTSGYPDYTSGAVGSVSANSHARHSGSAAGQANINCSACHNAVTTNGTAINGASPALHINANLQNVDFAATFGGSYTGGTKTCSTNYCHSDVQGTNGSGAPSTFASPRWGGAAMTCASCHADMSTGGSGSHALHATASGTVYDCAVCHGAGYSATGVVTATHANKTINVSFTGSGAGTIYSQAAGTPGDGYGSCSTSSCHGAGTMTWGSNTAAVTCDKCHGSAASAAGGTFKATSGNTAPTDTKVGAHVAHLASTHNMTSDIACTECHAAPADVNSAGHIDTALPAELTWGTLATKSGAVTPNYAGGSCSTTYCHGTGIKNNWPGATGLTPTWNDTTYLAGTTAEKCSKCHGYPPGGGHTPLTNCAQCHNHVNATNDGFIDATKHVNMIVEVSADNCTDCHTNANLSASHTNHADPNTVLAGKKISAGDYGQAWFYGVSYVNGAPKYSCGYCHPSTAATHMNSTNNLNLDPADAGATGTVKAKNGTPNFTQTPGVSVTCSSVYCHSNGFTPYAYKTTPNWFGGAFAGDGCAACHGNSPNTGGNTGSPAHGAHVVGIHYKDVFNGINGKVPQGGAVGTNAAHGDPATSTTINCNVCHNSTVAVAFNDSNTVCVTCHTGATVKGTMVISTTSTSHINGTPDVAFGTFSVNSKSQLRDSITSVAELNNSWTRTDGYKAGATSHDASKRTPTYAGGSCSTVDCHNGNSVSWNAGALDCGACHTALPQ